jgi:hypothetical protein
LSLALLGLRRCLIQGKEQNGKKKYRFSKEIESLSGHRQGKEKSKVKRRKNENENNEINQIYNLLLPCAGLHCNRGAQAEYR